MLGMWEGVTQEYRIVGMGKGGLKTSRVPNMDLKDPDITEEENL